MSVNQPEYATGVGIGVKSTHESRRARAQLFNLKQMIRYAHLLMEYSDNKNVFASVAVENRMSMVVVTTHSRRYLRAFMAYQQRAREQLKRLFQILGISVGLPRPEFDQGVFEDTCEVVGRQARQSIHRASASPALRCR